MIKTHHKVRICMIFNDIGCSAKILTLHTQGEVRERIATTITTPNKAWAKRRKHKKYALSRSFFGQYA